MPVGCQHNKKRFTVPPAQKYLDEKKCFKSDCINEGESCKECNMIQGKYIFYQQRSEDDAF